MYPTSVHHINVQPAVTQYSSNSHTIIPINDNENDNDHDLTAQYHVGSTHNDSQGDTHHDLHRNHHHHSKATSQLKSSPYPLPTDIPSSSSSLPRSPHRTRKKRYSSLFYLLQPSVLLALPFFHGAHKNYTWIQLIITYTITIIFLCICSYQLFTFILIHTSQQWSALSSASSSLYPYTSQIQPHIGDNHYVTHESVYQSIAKAMSPYHHHSNDTHPIWSPLTHLIIVPGHAVMHNSVSNDPQQPENWYLQAYQHNQLDTMLQHIERGVIEAGHDPPALLLFSGGETRMDVGPLTEAQSYWRAASAMRWYGYDSDHSGSSSEWYNNVRWRALTEEYSRDSYENLLYSICRFYEITVHYPLHITVIGFEFKRKRFIDLHRAAIKYPETSFTYIGIDPPEMLTNSTYHDAVIHGEYVNSYLPYQNDLYGCSEKLDSKRSQRNPYRRQPSNTLTCNELRPLLLWCGGMSGNEIYPGELPWSRKQ